MASPNVVMIVADDMGYGDFGVFNDGHVRTPNLDRLMNESICFSQQYAGSPVCSPSRAALLTGRYPHRTGAITPQEVRGLDRIATTEITIADALKHSGYATGIVGKWHNGAFDPRYHPNARGFDEFAGFRGGWSDYYSWRLDVNGSLVKSDGQYLTDVLTEESLGFIRRHQREPFFLSTMYNAPHSPLQAPEEYVRPYEEMGLTRGVSITYAMIEIMDIGVGRILDELHRLGLQDNTIVIFTSDNGPAFNLRDDQVPSGVSTDTRRYNCGFNGAKGSVLEGGIRVPMILRWPDGLPGGGMEISDFVHFVDWMPTLLCATGVARPDGPPLDGDNILLKLRGEQSWEKPVRFWQFNDYQPIGMSNAAMREGDWKLVRPALAIQYATAEDETAAQNYIDVDIEYKYRPENVTELMRELDPKRIVPESGTPELYNIANDPHEKFDIAQNHPERVIRMARKLEIWFEEVETERIVAHRETLSMVGV